MNGLPIAGLIGISKENVMTRAKDLVSMGKNDKKKMKKKKETILQWIVRTENLEALETYSMKIGNYNDLIQSAKRQKINLDHLEELLGMI